MEYKEAVKKVQARKPKENFMVVNLAYNLKIVLPYKDGITLLSALTNAEQYNDPYNGKHTIGVLEREKILFSTMSCEEYEQHKIAMLLNISIDDVKEFQLQID